MMERSMRVITSVFVLVTLMGSTAAASAQDSEGGTVNDYSKAQASSARQFASQAGYQPTEITMAQAGNLFLDAQRDGQLYSLVETPDHQIYASTGLPANGASSNTMAANPRPPVQ